MQGRGQWGAQNGARVAFLTRDSPKMTRDLEHTVPSGDPTPRRSRARRECGARAISAPGHAGRSDMGSQPQSIAQTARAPPLLLLPPPLLRCVSGLPGPAAGAFTASELASESLSQVVRSGAISPMHAECRIGPKARCLAPDARIHFGADSASCILHSACCTYRLSKHFGLGSAFCILHLHSASAFCIFREIRNVESARLCRGKSMQTACCMLQE